jgi:bifunctional non-homologous end joining protein LigD
VSVKISHPEKVLFPGGVTKGDLAAYYERVAEYMLPHVKGRPVSMQRFPDGIERKGFFHKDIPDYFPDWIARVEAPKHGGTVTHAVIENVDTLLYLANQNTITPHVWLSRRDRLDRPDRLVFDLDPSVQDFAAIRRAARDIGELLSEIGLAPHAMVTGSRGIHVWVPIRRDQGFEEVRDFARAVAQVMVDRRPDALTLEARKAKRGDRLLIDINRNAWAQTAVPPYAVRPRPEAPVATPLEWRELGDSRLRPDRFNVKNVFRRLAAKGDPWRDMGRRAAGLKAARRRLDTLTRDTVS